MCFSKDADSEMEFSVKDVYYRLLLGSTPVGVRGMKPERGQETWSNVGQA